MNQNPKPQDVLLSIGTEQKALLERALSGLNPTQTLWLSGYLAGTIQAQNQLLDLLGSAQLSVLTTAGSAQISENKPQITTSVSQPISGASQAQEKKLTILFGSRAGNSKSVAQKARKEAESRGYQVSLIDMSDYKLKNLKEERNLLVVVSTHGEGVPPIPAEELYTFIFSKRAPQLNSLQFSVCALGDKSYVKYCQTGIDFDARLEELGGYRVFARQDCDVDFTPAANIWIENSLNQFDKLITGAVVVNNTPKNEKIGVEELYSRANPFNATIVEKIKLNGRGSTKETYHLEISLANSGIEYEPGDALGIYPKNSSKVVDELLQITGLNPNDEVKINDKTYNLHEALQNSFEITTLNPDVLIKHNEFSQNNELAEILKLKDKLNSFVYGRDVIDILQQYPVKYTAETLCKTLRKLPARLYSIASSIKMHPEEVHLTVGVVRYEANNRKKEGACSSFLAERVGIDDSLQVFIERNEGFRLPKNTDAPIIMVGPGTGVAPFRAFVEERAETGAKGKNWLFFGDRNFKTDFLYQTEWQGYKKSGILTNLDVAFSRDTRNKVYVQDKMLLHSKELMKWLDEGAYFYVCGDMKRMSFDVQKALIQIVAKEKKRSEEEAMNYIFTMKKQRRYCEDVY